MRVVEMQGHGAPSVLAIGQRDKPVPKPGEVLIQVYAAGVNRPDIAQRQGIYPPPSDASDLLGLEVAGQIVGGDLNGSDYRLGDWVCALTPGGAYAEYCVAPIGHCLPIPQGMSVVEAAGLPETFFTVWVNVFQRAKLCAGESLLVHGGTSGIGTTAIQLARAFGAHVYTTVGSEEKVNAVRELGAQAINYKDQDFVVWIKEVTQGQGVDVILDMIGANYFARNLEVLALDGRLSLIALLGGAKADGVDLSKILRRRLRIMGSTLRPQSIAFKTNVAQELRKKVWPLLAQGAVKPLIYRQFDVTDVQQAHILMESSQHIGKIILTM